MTSRAVFWREECAPTTAPVLLDDDDEADAPVPELPPAAESGR
jgi:hypothetical protein